MDKNIFSCSIAIGYKRENYVELKHLKVRFNFIVFVTLITIIEIQNIFRTDNYYSPAVAVTTTEDLSKVLAGMM